LAFRPAPQKPESHPGNESIGPPSHGQQLRLNATARGKELNFCSLSFEDGVGEIVEHKIQDEQPGLHVAVSLEAPVLRIAAEDGDIHRPRCQVVHMASLAALDHFHVVEAESLLDEPVGQLAAVALDEAAELAAQEVTGVHGDQIQEGRFLFGIPGVFEQRDGIVVRHYSSRMFSIRW
jgi:hypothetical protein